MAGSTLIKANVKQMNQNNQNQAVHFLIVHQVLDLPFMIPDHLLHVFFLLIRLKDGKLTQMTGIEALIVSVIDLMLKFLYQVILVNFIKDLLLVVAKELL